jgi:hypothetical protein
LIGPALNVLLDKFFQLRPQMNLHNHILPHPRSEGRKGDSPGQPSPVSCVWRVSDTISACLERREPGQGHKDRLAYLH